MYKLVATDCDGTFIDSKGWLPEENKIAFQRLHQKGIPVVLVTGRNDFLTKDYVDELGFQCPVIGGNGATLGNIYTGERKYVNAMTKDEMNGVFDICDKFKVPCKVFTTEKCYTNDIDLKNGGIKLITVKYTKPIKTTIENVLETDIRKTADFKNVIKYYNQWQHSKKYASNTCNSNSKYSFKLCFFPLFFQIFDFLPMIPIPNTSFFQT